MLDKRIEKDLEDILIETYPLWEELRGQRIFVTGGTGFLGRWILESFSWANKKLDLAAQMLILTRNKKRFYKKCPHFFLDKALHFHEGDITCFTYPKKECAYIIHAATDSSYRYQAPLSMLDTIVLGTRRVLEFAKYCRAKKFLYISSGAIYGTQQGLQPMDEKKTPQLDITKLSASYAIGKCIGEHLCHLYADQCKFSLKIARCFSFLGPYLPMDLHFAIGNFISDRLKGESIKIKGDGRSYRSYLYTADLCIWLWTILFKGKNLRAYNVGSDEAYSLQEIATRIARDFKPKLKIQLLNQPHSIGIAPINYIPDITRVKEDLNIKPRMGLMDSIGSTIAWFQARFQHARKTL